MGNSGAVFRRQLTASFAVIVIALACLSPGSLSSSDGVRTCGPPAVQAGVSPHLALVAQNHGKQQLHSVNVAVLAETIGAVPIAPATAILTALCPESLGTALLRVDGSRAPPQLLQFA